VFDLIRVNLLRSALPVTACLLAALYVMIFPLQDYDTFWHLAYGRAMVETGSFINHEIFSYTAQGKYLGSHSQLAQVFLYLLWAAGGAKALLAFKLAAASLVFLLVVNTSRLFGVGTTAGGAMALAVLVMGMNRVVERPELFSILFQALLLWILFRSRKFDYPHRWLWCVPLILVLWDYLHGALYGLVVLCAFAGTEVCRQLVLPKLGFSRFADETPFPAVKRLIGWCLVSLAAMLLHPNGLLNYAHFWRVASAGAEYRMFGEFMPPHFAQFYPYWLFLVCALALILLGIRQVDLTALAVMVPFLYLSLTYNRAVLAFGLAAVPAVAQALAQVSHRLQNLRFRKILTALLVMVMLGGVLAYKKYYVIESHRFGLGVNDQVFPVGSVRFAVANNLSGNMYNMDAFGGYLSFMVSPQRKIFNYNQPGVFTALFDYLHKPETRSQWQINYAFVGTPEEINMFEHDGFIPVYWEPGGAVFVRNSAANADIINKYRVVYFRALLSEKELLAFGKDPRSADKFMREVSAYLAHRQDPRIVKVFAQLLRESPAVRDDRQRSELLAPVMKYNVDSVDLLAIQGEISYRTGDSARAETLFRQVLDCAPTNVPARIGLGYLLYDRKNFAEAQEHFSIVTREHPESADAHYAFGLASFRLCQRQQAREGFEKFLELAPASPYAGKAKAFLVNLETGCGS